MLVNNFNESSTGINIEGTFFYDIDSSQREFDENFELLSKSNFIYNPYGQIDTKVSFTVKASKQTLVEYLNDIVGDFDWIKESKSDLMDEVINQNDIDLLNYNEVKATLEDYNIKLIPNTEIKSIVTKGYSQGDYAKVFYLPERLKELWGNDVNESELQKEIDHLFWDAPIYGNVKVNDIDFDYEFDAYEWEREKFINQIVKYFNEKKETESIDMELLKHELERVIPQEINYNG